ncbi:MAG TPA: zf-HC2 domain-containing protein [Vicinamibacteria bacterium]|nr:zf-HC2 domain-containing protein [Vicinamibacteria bacterium]
MSGHEQVVALLELAAAGGLSSAEERLVREHVALCETCRIELEAYQDLARELKNLPTPMPSRGVAERVLRIAHLELASRADERLGTLVLVFLLLFSWTVTWLSLAVVRLVTGDRSQLMDVLSTGRLGWSAAYLAVAWLGGAAVVLLLGLKYRKSRRFA